MSDEFYRSFEERYYAPRNVIKELRRQYLPFIEPLISIYPGAQTYDAGCGRGEWLELMLEQGFSPIGIDLDEGMLASCRDNNLPGKQGDAIEHLLEFPDSFFAVVSAFHVVEHIDFEALQKFVHHAWRVLKPGGLLIMETPNPENIVVATRNFYLDPTHKKPIPSQLLSFVTETEGFTRSKILRLQESKGLVEKENINLQEVFSGASPDYAILAQKEAAPEILAEFDSSFAREYGVSLDELLTRWDRRFAQVEKNGEKAQLAAASTAQIEAKAVEIETRTREIEARAAQVEAKVLEIEARARQAEASALAERANVGALMNSTSWKVTAPMRFVSTYASAFKNISYRSYIKFLLQHLALYVDRRPRLKRLLLKVLDRFPSFKSRLSAAARVSVAVSSPKSRNVPAQLANLTPRARQIYHDLKIAREQAYKESP